TLFGADRAKAGIVKLNGTEIRIKQPADAIRHGIAFLTEDRKGEGLLLDFTLRENLSLPTLEKRAKGTIISRQAEEQFADGYLKKLRVKHHSMEQKVKSLSGGNQQKIVLGKWLGAEPDVLILDEPTRGVDVGAKKEIYTIMSELAESGVAIIMVSSDLPEVLGMSDRIVVMREGVVTGTLAKDEATQEKVMTYATGGQ
ncbi:MAG: sugar ABC transporter ATP-binding protein, partial [Exiguobacterium chiriqhucha]|uniref:ATP-binding cassette domain-containing protein n=1 Tax=Exiguobacterium chiriqhucha TaxID=1385984 RepID=UPI00144C13A6